MAIWNEVTSRCSPGGRIPRVGANRIQRRGEIGKEAKARGNALDMQTFPRRFRDRVTSKGIYVQYEFKDYGGMAFD